MSNYYWKEFFDNKIYRKEWESSTDYNIIVQEFHEYVCNLNISDKIRLCCYNQYKSLSDIKNILNYDSEQVIKNTLSRLNKSLDLSVNKKNGYNYYMLSDKGLRYILTNTSDFAQNSKYIQKFVKYEINPDNFNKDEIIKCFHKFLSKYYKKQIKKIINEDLKFLEISFSELSLHEMFLTDLILNSPERVLPVMEETLKKFADLEDDEIIKIRLIDIPSVCNIKIGSHRQKDIGKLVCFEGIIRRKSDVKPRLKYLNYLCCLPTCMYSQDLIRVPQFEEKARILKNCPRCKSGVEMLSKEMEDSMIMILEQDFTERKSDFDSKKIHVKIDSDLTDDIKYEKLKISSKVKIIGFLKEIPKNTKSGAESVNYDYILEANNIIFVDEDEDLIITKQDEKEIKNYINQDNPYKNMVKSYLPRIYDNKLIKEALILQHIGSSFDNERNESHILILGDPSTAKTEMIINSLKYSPRHVYSSGTSSTKAGMTATAIKDELTGSFVLEPGVLPRANGGMAGLDEMDKLHKEDADSMTEALEQQTISVNKANISAQLQTRCSFLAGANPKFSKFDDNIDITKQINFNPALLSRFDLIFILKDRPDPIKDTHLISHLLRNYRDNYDSAEEKELLSTEFIKKYIYYCKNNFKPVLSKEADDLISRYYVTIRKNSGLNNIVSFTPRQIKGLIRFASAHAKFHQRNIIKKEDVVYAYKLFNEVLKDLGEDNIRSIENAFNNFTDQKSILKSLYDNNSQLSLSDLKSITNLDIDILKKELHKLKESGEIYEPRKEVYILIEK